MSRAALWRQEGAVREREERAYEVFQSAVEEGQRRQRSNKSVLPLWGPPDNFHFNPLLLNNTIKSPYFQKCCEKLQNWNAVVDEIYYEVKHLQPFSLDKAPSSAFCLLLRLLTLRVTDREMDLTLKHTDSPYIRGIGFLYLRYAGPPETVYNWIRPYLQDEEEIKVEPNTNAKSITMGEYVRKLFQSREYHGTPLPRFPNQVERNLLVKLLETEKVFDRSKQHYKNQQHMKIFQTLGSHIMALYGDDETPTTWYKAVVDRVLLRDEESGVIFKYPRFIVTFPEYGNTETVSLGEVDVCDGQWQYDRQVRPEDVYEDIKKREREHITSDRNWARKPPSTKHMLSAVSQRQQSSVQDELPRHTKDHYQRHHEPQVRTKDTDLPTSAVTESHKRQSAEEVAVNAEKKRKLMARYG